MHVTPRVTYAQRNTDRPLVNQPFNLNTMPQRYSSIVSNLLNATQRGAAQMARVTTRAERREGRGIECKPVFPSRGNVHAGQCARRTYKQITVRPEREFAKIFIAGACFYPFAPTRVSNGRIDLVLLRETLSDLARYVRSIQQKVIKIVAKILHGLLSKIT